MGVLFINKGVYTTRFPLHVEPIPLKRKKNIWKDTTYNGISEYSSGRFVIIKGHLLVCFFCALQLFKRFLSVIRFCSMTSPARYYVSTSFYSVPLSLIYVYLYLRYAWMIILIEFWSAFLSQLYVRGSLLVAIRPIVCRIQLSPSRTDIVIYLVLTSKGKPLRALCLYLKMEEIVAHLCWRGRHAAPTRERPKKKYIYTRKT